MFANLSEIGNMNEKTTKITWNIGYFYIEQHLHLHLVLGVVFTK
jgi:hypothetical protein